MNKNSICDCLDYVSPPASDEEPQGPAGEVPVIHT